MSSKSDVTSRKVATATLPVDPNAPALYTVKQFARAHQISRANFYNLLRNGQGPDLMQVGFRKFITFESAARWREERTKRAKR